MSFVETLIKQTERYESPTSFWRWSGYATIAAVLRDSCFKQDGTDKLFPNIYVLILAESAAYRKGRPVKLCEKLVSEILNTKLISGRTSIQAILDELARSETNPTTGKLIKGGSAIFTAQELAAGLVQDPSAVQILTDIYDYKHKYTHTLRGMPKFHINDICFSMCAASNEDLLKDVYDQRALFGGLLGRTFLIKPDEFRPGNSLFDIDTFNFDPLLQELEKIVQIRGTFQFKEEAIRCYDEWYLPFRKSYAKRADKSGVMGRIHTGVLKLAMIICINDTKDLVVTKKHVEQAITESMLLMPAYREFLMGTGKSSLSEVGAIVIPAIYAAPDHSLSRKRILERHWNDFDAEALEKYITTVSQAGLVEISAYGSDLVYTLTDRCLELLFPKDETKAKGAGEANE